MKLVYLLLWLKCTGVDMMIMRTLLSGSTISWIKMSCKCLLWIWCFQCVGICVAVQMVGQLRRCQWNAQNETGPRDCLLRKENCEIIEIVKISEIHDALIHSLPFLNEIPHCLVSMWYWGSCYAIDKMIIQCFWTKLLFQILIVSSIDLEQRRRFFKKKPIHGFVAL